MNFPDKFEVKSPISLIRAFFIPYKKLKLKVLAAIEPDGWEHVSVSLPGRDPTWEEMCFIKDLFFEREDVCLQFHSKHSQYVNLHQHCLHIWKPSLEVIKAMDRD